MRLFGCLLLGIVVLAACERAPMGRAADSTYTHVVADSAAPVSQDTAGARAFVHEFYTWYVPQALQATGRPAALVLRERPEVLAPTLRQALAADEVGQTAASGEVVGLDFDPFLNSQDPCERYEVGDIRLAGPTVAFAIYAVCDGQRSPTPAVLAMVARHGVSWEFENFHYPASNTDLQAVLRQLVADSLE